MCIATVAAVACTHRALPVRQAGVLPGNLSSTDADMSVFVNVGADWFTETRQVSHSTVGADGGVTVSFEKGHYASANDKVFVQGSKEFITEAGEWALDSEAGIVYLWPRDQAAMSAGDAVITMATTVRVLEILGEGWEPENQATAIDFSGLVFSGSDFSSDYLLFTRANDTPVQSREGLVRIENATDVTVKDCAVLDAGHSAFWLQSFAQNISLVGNWIERPGSVDSSKPKQHVVHVTSSTNPMCSGAQTAG